MSSFEKAESSKEPKGMDWMYKGPASLVNREDYLTGRQVDKALNMINEAEKGNAYSYLDDVQKDLTPVSIFASTRNEGPIDVIRKIKEDPLYQIQKKEEESLKQLLNNPVKMKQIRQMAEKRKEQEKKSSKSESSKKRRRSRSKSSSSSSSSDSDDPSSAGDIDKLLAAKLSALKEVKDVLLKSKKYSSDSSDDDRADSRKQSYRDSTRDRDSRDRYHKAALSSSSRRSREKDDRGSRYERDRHSSSGRRDRDRDGNDSRNRDSKYSSNYKSSSSSASSSRRPEPAQKRKIDEDERERKLKEMMENAKWRDDQRSQNVQKQREEMKKEEERLKTKRDADFIRKQLVKAAETGSVEKRIKSNSYNIQRSKTAMNQNFARR